MDSNTTFRPLDHDRALVLLSGGQDSGTCLFWAVKQFGHVEALSIGYGQRHAVELACARDLCRVAGVELHHRGIPGAFEGSALVDGGDTDAPHALQHNLPSTFTPGRNAVMLALAANVAYLRDCGVVVVGMLGNSQYPDCQRPFLRAMNKALNFGLDTRLAVRAPLLAKTKAQVWKMAHDLGVLDVIIEHTHTDFNGDRSERHPWGYGTLDNPASRLRAESFWEAVEQGWIPRPEGRHNPFRRAPA